MIEIKFPMFLGELSHKTAGSFSNIAGFNNWVTNILPKQIEKFSFTIRRRH